MMKKLMLCISLIAGCSETGDKDLKTCCCCCKCGKPPTITLTGAKPASKLSQQLSIFFQSFDDLQPTTPSK